MFDSQVKRIHEYKRQHLNVLYILTLYLRLKRNPKLAMTPRTFLFGGKAAAGYAMAKLIIKLINSVAEVINHDPEVKQRIKVFFLPDYNSRSGKRYPAADLASRYPPPERGIGDRKHEVRDERRADHRHPGWREHRIRDAVGHENFFLFGLTAPQVLATKTAGDHPRAI